MKIVGVIPARSGSKTILDKNIKSLCGKPLVYYTAREAHKSRLDKVVLSTDSQEYADIVKSFDFRVEVPFLRPKELAGDTPRLPEVCQGILDHYRGIDMPPNFDAVMLLQPTAPLREARHIDEAIDVFLETPATSVVSVCEVPDLHNPEWVFVNQYNLDFIPSGLKVSTGKAVKDRIKRRQELPKAYATNGAIYLFRSECLYEDPPNIYGDRVMPYVMDSYYNISIDDMDDWKEVEKRMKNEV